MSRQREKISWKEIVMAVIVTVSLIVALFGLDYRELGTEDYIKCMIMMLLGVPFTAWSLIYKVCD